MIDWSYQNQKSTSFYTPFPTLYGFVVKLIPNHYDELLSPSTCVLEAKQETIITSLGHDYDSTFFSSIKKSFVYYCYQIHFVQGFSRWYHVRLLQFILLHLKFELWDLPIDSLPIVSRFLFVTFFISNHDNSSFITSAISSMSELCYQNQKLSSFSYFFTVALTKFHHFIR